MNNSSLRVLEFPPDSVPNPSFLSRSSKVERTMTDDFDELAPSPTGDDCLSILRSLDRDQILEILRAGFCSKCEALISYRIRKLQICEKSNGKRFPSLTNGFKDTKLPTATNSAEFNSMAESTTMTSSSWPIDRNTSDSTGIKKDASPASVSSKNISRDYSIDEIFLKDGIAESFSPISNELTERQREQIRISKVGRKKDFSYRERINGNVKNILKGLELHTHVFNSKEQNNIVACVYDLQRKGRQGEFRERTYSEPRKWMRGKGRVTIQFGCCYNYAMDRAGNSPGIVRDEEVDPIPPMFKRIIKRMVRWDILPPSCIPDSCIVNMYDEGDCIPPHIDHHDFLRPFCTVSFLSQCDIRFGTNLNIVGPGEFSGPVSISLPVGSVLILNGNGADVAKHCVPSVPAKRISITFRKMDDSKLPYKFVADPDLVGLKPFDVASYLPEKKSDLEDRVIHKQHDHKNRKAFNTVRNNPFVTVEDEFPPLGRHKSTATGRSHTLQ